MHQMFENIAVDGSSSCIPGEVLGEEVVREGSTSERAFGEDTGEAYASPGASLSNSQRSTPLKRSSTSTATSPHKPTKNPMVKVMKGIHATLEANCAIANKVMQGEFRFNSIKECIDLAVQCGAAEGIA